MPNNHSMPLYEGTKQLYAKPLTRGAYNELRGWPTPMSENPMDDGYLVEYLGGGEGNHEDFAGYISWTPKDVFESTYRPVESFSDRLNVERGETHDRLTKLKEFLSAGKPDFISVADWRLLHVQAEQMQAYIDTIHLRINRLTPQEACEFGDLGYPVVTKRNLATALSFLAAGFRIARATWEQNNTFVTAKREVTDVSADQLWCPHNKAAAIANGGQATVKPYLTQCNGEGEIQMGWMFSQEDIFANDWVVLYDKG